MENGRSDQQRYFHCKPGDPRWGKSSKRDIETGETKPQGNATLEGATFTITNLSTHPVLVNEKLYESGQVVLTLKTDKSGAAATAKDALPYGHYRIDETEAPDGYLNEGKLSQEFDIQENGKIIDLTSKETRNPQSDHPRGFRICQSL